MGGKTTIYPPHPLFAKGRKIVIFRGENLLYSHFSVYPGKGENGYGGKMAL